MNLPSYLSAVAAVVYLFCAYRVVRLDARSPANLVGGTLNVVLALWAFASIFCYFPIDASAASFWYRTFAFCWNSFASILLHFCLLTAGVGLPKTRARRVFAFTALYAPAAFFLIATNTFMVAGFEFRGGYWFPVFSDRGWFLAYTAYYVSFCVLSLLALIRGRLRATGKAERRRLNLMIASIAAALAGGFVTDTAFMLAGVDFPNVAILWILIWAVGVLAAMNRYSFLSPFPVGQSARIVNAMADAFFYLDESGRVVWANDSAKRLCGAAPLSRLARRPLASLVECGGQVRSKFEAVLAGTAESCSELCSFVGSSIAVSARLAVLHDRSGPNGFIATCRDLTEELRRARAESLLEETGLLLDSFIGHSLDGILVTDPEGKIARWNSALETISGIGESEVRGRFLWDVFTSVARDDDPSRNHVRYLCRSLVSAFEGSAAEWTQQNRGIPIRDRRGRDLVLQVSGFFIPTSGGPVFSAIVRDVTEERRAADETVERIKRLDHAQKMDAIGTLSGGLAHDFNNALGGIVGAISLIRMGIAEGSYERCADLVPEVEIIERSADRASKTVRSLLSLTRKRNHEFVLVRLDEIVQRVVDVACYSIDPAVSVSYERTRLPARLRGDASQLEQLVLNLIINASHAMTIMRKPGETRGGTVSVSVSRSIPDHDLRAVNPLAEDRPYWVVCVRDEGVGISAEIKTRIFDPFFTTKPPESSSGLGLAMVHSISRQHGGFVELESSLGKGSSFWVYLPAADDGEREGGERLSSAKKGSGVVLVAEDEDSLRSAETAMLKALGYHAVPVPNGMAAVEAFAAEPGRFAAVLLDMTMPELTGAEALARMRSLRPDVPAVIASGYASADAVPAVFLPKPFTIEDLGESLSRAVSDRRPADASAAAGSRAAG